MKNSKEIRIGIEKWPNVKGYSPYFWIGSQGFHLASSDTLKEAKWTIEMLKKAFTNNPNIFGTTDIKFIDIKGTGLFGGLTKEEEKEYLKKKYGKTRI